MHYEYSFIDYVFIYGYLALLPIILCLAIYIHVDMAILHKNNELPSYSLRENFKGTLVFCFMHMAIGEILLLLGGMGFLDDSLYDYRILMGLGVSLFIVSLGVFILGLTSKSKSSKFKFWCSVISFSLIVFMGTRFYYGFPILQDCYKDGRDYRIYSQHDEKEIDKSKKNNDNTYFFPIFIRRF